ncbi:MAG: helix-turn-helix transcriptional regulator [Sneathiella sp.]|nr:helix-turn-helix transcriptional regulator [Sneathiella sp.]
MIEFRNDDSDGKPNQIDVYVGKRMRMRRTILGMSQANLGQALGLTFQQIQKYEQGANRIGSSRLYDLSTTLGVPVTYFFEDMEIAAQTNDLPHNSPDLRKDPAAKRETLELVRAFTRIDDKSVRTSILNMIVALTQKYKL